MGEFEINLFIGPIILTSTEKYHILGLLGLSHASKLQKKSNVYDHVVFKPHLSFTKFQKIIHNLHFLLTVSVDSNF